ncbi:ACT domain-containing protein [Mariprofundus erugo]|uniref:ACT domain-containing protein n=1 Tax=Mariprofundus erugo TaxID=2528639 RepID=A0A5R9GZ42_9PROT|nr:ACT domain-containing protein [Mariprofundus erugo]TLS68164.1 ACT domain-containing protein [Mariprofundus erugo]
MSSILLSISGHDRPGIVRDVSEALLHLEANIEDSSMTALRGRFTMMMIVSLPDDRSLGELKATLAELEQRTHLTVQSQVISDEEAATQALQPDHVITVHGADRVGIVHAVTAALADVGASIVDVSTEQRESESGDVYMMVLEIAANGADAMDDALQAVAGRIGVSVEVHVLDDAIL